MGTLTLTGLVPVIYAAFDVVSRERVGLIPAVSQDFSAERAALNQTITSPVVGSMPAEDLVATNVAADTPNQTIGNVQMTISKSRSVPFGITGEETKGLQTAGTLGQINRDRIAQAVRTLSNEMESDLAGLFSNCSRAYGTAAATPFGTGGDLSDFANCAKVLDDNGAPLQDWHMVLGSAAVANIRGKQSGLFKVNEAGTDDLLRRGVIGDVEGFAMHQSAGIKKAVVVGTGTSYTSTTAGFAIGITSIPLITGSGTVLAGDVVTFAGDTNKYIVATGVAAPGTIVLVEPGLQQALPASAVAMTIVAAAARNMFFHRSAIQLATRAPALPEGGDDADDNILVTDPVSGITFEFTVYRQKRQVRYEVNLAWGFKMITPRHAGNLLG